jgi:hypothetical protein
MDPRAATFRKESILLPQRPSVVRSNHVTIAQGRQCGDAGVRCSFAIERDHAAATVRQTSAVWARGIVELAPSARSARALAVKSRFDAAIVAVSAASGSAAGSASVGPSVFTSRE